MTTLDSNYGKRTQISDYVEINGTVRLPRGGQARGGVSTGRLHTETCFIIDSPQALLNCDNKPPFKPDWKALVAYPLPWWGLQVGATFANTTGNEIAASWTAPASAVQGLGRPLASGANGTVVVPLIAPGTQYSDRRTQLDSRELRRAEGARKTPTPARPPDRRAAGRADKMTKPRRRRRTRSQRGPN